MKKAALSAALPLLVMLACNKSNSTDAISLTASATEVSVGQTVSVTANTSTNALSWSVNPAATARATYTVSTEKTNYFTFSQAGEYVIGVRARGLALDSVHVCNHADSAGHHFQDSVWNYHIDSVWHGHGNHLGGCKKGQDSASVIITVK